MLRMYLGGYKRAIFSYFTLLGYCIKSCIKYLFLIQQLGYLVDLCLDRTVCTERVRYPYTEHAASGLPNPFSLGGGGMIYTSSRPADVTTRSPRTVAECLLTRSMLIKMYYLFMVCACIYVQLYLQSVNFGSC